VEGDAGTVSPADERRHPGVAETWWFDAADPAAGFGVVVRLAYRPAERVAWWWVGLVGAGPVLVALRAHDVPLPPRGTDVRTDGLWATVRCETPLEHWTVGLECFAVAYDDPWEALRSERGDVIPLGLDLEWEAAASATARPDGSGYGQACAVSGEVLLGDARVDVDVAGYRQHTWAGAADLPDGPERVRGEDPVAVCPFAVPGRPWVETLYPGGWGGAPYTRS
jgi:hypothetical protein